MRALPTRKARAIPIPAPGPLARVADAFAQLIRGRLWHSDGTGYDATLTITSGWEGVAALAPGAEHRAVVRLSDANGLPGPIPDARGLALRLPHLYGPGMHQDFLLVTSSRGPVLQQIALPGIHGGQPYSSLIPYRIGDNIRVLGALPVGTLHYKLAVAPISGGWTPIGDLQLKEPLPAEQSRRIEFRVANYGAGIRPLPAATAR